MNKALLNKVYHSCIVLVLVFLPAGLNAQLFHLGADASKPARYPVYTGNDSVFVFYSSPGTDTKGSLLAKMPVPGPYNFDWFRYNTESGDFDISLPGETGVSQSEISGLPSGGYKVRIWDGSGTDTTFIAWVHIDKLLVSIVKDSKGNLLKSAYTCDYLTLSASVSLDTFYYYDPLSRDTLLLKNGFDFLWTSDNSDLIIPNKNRILDPNTTYSPPYLDTWYILTATDSFGMMDIDSVFYESIQVKPKFKFMAFDKEETRDFVDASEPYEGDSPLKIRFINESINGYSYEWIFSDSARSDLDAVEKSDSFDYQPEFTYKIPNDYYPALVATSKEGCIDTFRIDSPISVLPSLLEVPNVFSPDGNGLNDYFKVNFQSIKEFNIRIFDRAGKLVYKAEVSDMYSWEGWDGNVLNSDRKASPGAYFYVIDATGWDNEHYHKGQFRGVVYLFRYGQ